MLYTSDKVATCALSGKCLGSLLHLLLQCILGDKILADCKPEVKTLDVKNESEFGRSSEILQSNKALLICSLGYFYFSFSFFFFFNI